MADETSATRGSELSTARFFELNKRPAGEESGAVRFRPAGLRLRIRIYVRRHFQALFLSLGQLWRSPLAAFMAMTAIGITLCLPAGVVVFLFNVEQLTGGWRNASISLFLEQGVTKTQVAQLHDQLARMPEIRHVATITPDDALAEVQQLTGFDDVLSALDKNPLPYVLVVDPADGSVQPGVLRDLVERLKALQNVDLAQFDMQWLERLQAMIDIARRALFILAGLLGVAVLVTVGNTTRLAIEHRRDEIEITKLIGAKSAFIRRPFLYSGFWLGLMGGAVAWLLTYVGYAALSDPVLRLAALYKSDYGLQFMDWRASTLLIGVSVLLGLVGAWLAVGKHLRDIERA